jgi:integrase
MAWETLARAQVKSLGGKLQKSYLTIIANKGRIQLKRRVPDCPIESVLLPYRWHEDDWGDAYTRIRNIFSLIQQGHNLKQAAVLAEGKSPVTEINWHGAIEKFHEYKTRSDNAIKEVTWRENYLGFLNSAVVLLNDGSKVITINDVFRQVLSAWESGSGQRKDAAGYMSAFFRFCVDELNFDERWLPPDYLKKYIGRKPAGSISRTQKGDALTDQQILDVIESLPTDKFGLRWRNAIKLMAVYGLRPVECNHVIVKHDETTGEPYLFCAYIKRTGKGETFAGEVQPLPLRNAKGEEIYWNIVQQMLGDNFALPDMNRGAANTYLARQSGWKKLREQMQAEGKNAVPYSFRHSYSLRAHQLGIIPENVALSMRHSVQVHFQSYPYTNRRSMRADFARARQDNRMAKAY